ncbi:putative peptidoglycan lipid II flippase [Caminicella sporogenes DSM 14501]|uniref:Probable lipid II flippase MurJ n=1 Tax=Caminicella sporogenes DSM 14501 TaxID=1121266 RepID=A0A1M6PWM3_9FIRM|nr:murein biosynthesis integral membrane protein MurJ [Caminicella sporogenes]RKD21939.1 murein biosynthesis integral membrane protein MurJ [Caminicella sporogenes]SHK12393.1 putative peptidoglycan lipid II flippase [Caminicella sporogenes DSM 14501]
MKKTAIFLMILTIFSKIFGFTRDVTLSYFYGASNISDAYLISITIPMVIFSFIGTGIITGYIPMYSKIENSNGVEEANKYTNNLVNILIVICTVIIILGLLFTNQIVKVFASGFEGETLILAVQFTRISLLGIYFTGLIYIFNGFLQLKGNYTIPALAGFPLNFIIIASIFLSSKTNILVLSIGSVIAIASQLVLVLPFAYKKGYKYKFIFNIKDKYIKTMAYMALPIIIGVSVNQINTLIDRTIASQIATGGISALNYANRLNGFVQGIFVLSISTVMYPMISKMAAENNMIGLKKTLSEAISSINISILPATVGAMIFAEPVVRLLFGRGAFDSQAISMTSYALFFYSIGMIGFGLREVLSRAFYAMQDTKTPMINAAIAMVMNIILNIILSKFLGIGGLALATSISAIFCTMLLFISLRKKIGPFGMKNITISFIKILCASLVMGLLAKLSYNNLLDSLNANLALIISITIGAIIYFVIIYFMKIEEVDVVINAVKKKLKRSVVNE